MTDWRLQGQEDFLQGRRLRRSRWWPYRPGWDHDHCEFCWADFGAAKSDHIEFDGGYVTAEDNYHWICTPCFEDFHEQFEWTVVTDP